MLSTAHLMQIGIEESAGERNVLIEAEWDRE